MQVTGKKIFGTALVYTSGALLIRGLSFFLLPLYSRFLTPRDFGILAVVDTMVTALSLLFSFGMGGAVTRFYFDWKSRRDLKECVGTLFLFLLLGSGLGVLLAQILGQELLRRLPDLLRIPSWPYLPLALGGLFFSLFAVIPLSLLVAQEKPGAYLAFSFSSFFLGTILSIWLVVFLRQGAQGSLTAVLLSNFALAVAYVAFLLKKMKIAFRKGPLLDALKFGLPTIPHLLAHWSLTYLDRWILQAFLPLSQVGIYSIGYQFGLLMNVVITSFSNAWAPFFFRTAQVKDLGDLEDPAAGRAATGGKKSSPKEVLGKKATLIFALFAFLALTVSLLSREVVMIFLPTEYLPSITIIPVVTLGALFLGMYAIAVVPIFYTKKSAVLPFLTVTASLVNLLCNLLWIPKLGIMGAAYATVAGYLLLFFLVFAFSQHLFPIPYEWKKISAIFFLFLLLWAPNLLALSREPVEQSQGLMAPLVVKLMALTLFLLALKKLGLLAELRASSELFYRPNDPSC